MTLLPLLLLFAGAQAPNNPLEPASRGMVQCYGPNKAAKTCKSIATYAPPTNGVYDNGATILLAPTPLIVMKIHSPVRVENGQVCGPLRDEDLKAAHFEVNGQPASAADTQKLADQLRGAMAAVLGKDVCTAYVPGNEPGVLIAKATAAGAAPPADQTVVWVSPAEGYKVGR